MQEREYKAIKEWFDGYIEQFYGRERAIDLNLDTKKGHTGCVVREMDALCGELGVEGSDAVLARAVALLHDVGRFRQFSEYRTYNDVKSVNHCELGVEVLEGEGVLAGLGDEERDVILTAVRCHGMKAIPEGLGERERFFVKLVRDTDKLDVFRVVINYTRQYMADPENFHIELEFSTEPGYSERIAGMVLNNELIDYRLLESLDDMRLLQLSWVFDIYFPQTLKKVRERGCLEEIIQFLPGGEMTRRIERHVFDYVDGRIQAGVVL